MPLTRRQFLIGTGGLGGLGVLGYAYYRLTGHLPLFPPPPYPNEFLKDGNLIVLPSSGHLIIGNDFQGRKNDFELWLEKTDAIKKIRNGEDLYLVINGDTADPKADDLANIPNEVRDGDSEIFRIIQEAQEDLKGESYRLIHLQGNHENQGMAIYKAIRDQYSIPVLGGIIPYRDIRLVLDKFEVLDTTMEEFLVTLHRYAISKGDVSKLTTKEKDLLNAISRSFTENELGLLNYLAQFNFAFRMTENEYDFLRKLPTTVYGNNGVIVQHGGPSQSANSLRDLAHPNGRILDELLWNRPPVMYGGGDYSVNDLLQFLSRMQNAGILVLGHTAVTEFPEHYVHNGVAMFPGTESPGAVVTATSYGARPGEKAYLSIDLSKEHKTLGNLIEEDEIIIRQTGQEICHLESPQKAIAYASSLGVYAPRQLSRRGLFEALASPLITHLYDT